MKPNPHLGWYELGLMNLSPTYSSMFINFTDNENHYSLPLGQAAVLKCVIPFEASMSLVKPIEIKISNQSDLAKSSSKSEATQAQSNLW